MEWYNQYMVIELKDKRLGLTKKRIEALERLGIENNEQLLTYYPFRYETLNVSDFSSWKEKDKVTFEGVVASQVRSWHFGRNRSGSKFDVQAMDHIIHVTIFNRPWLKLEVGQTVTVNGIYGRNCSVTAVNLNNKPLSEQEAVTPMYSVREGITQKTVRACVKKALDCEIDDDMPVQFHRAYRLLDRRTALNLIHNPSSMEDVQKAVRTLKYYEFLHFFTAMELMRNENGADAYKTPRMFDHERMKQAVNALPYPLTQDQKSSLQDICRDMESSHIMVRLLQGDVGCGKTAVAGLALYACALSGYQGALLAPTEILARQHLASLKELIHDPQIRTAVLYSGMNEEDKKETVRMIHSGEIDIIIGTHSILQETVQFHKLGLVVADEQQRFGVEQRRTLLEKGQQADFLLMSATPIPRTLASAVYGDLSVSTIETMPPGRKEVVTKLIQENSFRSVLKEIKQLLASGRQLYVICASVEKNEDFHARAVEDMQKNLSKLFQPDYQVGLLHGRMSSQEKEDAMQAFAQNRTQILVSTTVVEVGMNVVNATGMIVYDADRFGLSQIHQLRGRVQRGSSQGYCWLLTDSKDPLVLERLNVLVNHSSGFEISREDLRLRGPGDILGTRQSGIPDLILGSLIDDQNMTAQARKDAGKVVQEQDNPDFIPLVDEVRKRRENAAYID